MPESSEEVSSDDDRNISESFTKLKKMEYHKKPSLCYHCGLQFPDMKTLLQHFADVYGSSLKNKSSQKNMSCSQNKNMEVNKISDKFRSSIADEKYLCLKCKIAFTRRDSKVHRQNQHPELPKYSKLYEVIKIFKNGKPVDKSEIEGNNDNRKRPILNRKEQNLTKSKAGDDIAISNKQNEEEKKTSKKRKLDQSKANDNIAISKKQDEEEEKTSKKRKLGKKNGDSEKPQIFRCDQCSLNFVSAEMIELHFNNKCQMSSANYTICDVCGLNFTDEDELIKHLVNHHVNNKSKQFYILIVTNATLVSNNEGILKDNISPSKKSTDRSEDEFEPKKNMINTSQKRYKQHRINCNKTRVTKINESQVDINTQQCNKCDQSSQQSTHKTDKEMLSLNAHVCNSQKKSIKSPQNDSVKKVNEKVSNQLPKRRHTFDGFNIDNKNEAIQAEPNNNGSSKHVIGQTKDKVLDKRSFGQTMTDKPSSINSIVKNIATKPQKISRRRLTYHDLNVKEVPIKRSLIEHLNQKGDTDDVGKRNLVTFAQIHNDEKENRRVQIATGKTCDEIRLEKNFNVQTANANLKTQRHEFVVVENQPQNTISSLICEKQNVTLNNNTKGELNIFKNEEKVYKLYKCGECNVHFFSSSECDTHMRDHIPKDPTECSKCNDCGFMFTNDSLGKHKRDCPGHKHINKVIVEEYNRLNTKDEIVKEIFHTQYIVSKYIEDNHSASVPGIDKSEIASMDNQLNVDNQKSDIMVGVVKNDIKITGNENADNMREAIEQVKDKREIKKLQNFAEFPENQRLVQSNQQLKIYLSYNHDKEHLAGANYKEKSFALNVNKENKSNEKMLATKTDTCELNERNNNTRQDRQSKAYTAACLAEILTSNKVSSQQVQKNVADPIIPLMAVEGPTTTEYNPTVQQTSSKNTDCLETYMVQSVANTTITDTTVEAPTTTIECNLSIQQTSSKSTECLETHCTTNCMAQCFANTINTNMTLESPNTTQCSPTLQQTSSKGTEFLETRGATNCFDNVPNTGQLNKHHDSTTEQAGKIPTIVKTETITEDSSSVSYTYSRQIFEKLTGCHDIVEIRNGYFEERGTVTIIESDEDSDCEIVNVEFTTNRKNNKQYNNKIPLVDDASNSSEKTMILDNHEFFEDSVNFVDFSIKTEFKAPDPSNGTNEENNDNVKRRQFSNK